MKFLIACTDGCVSEGETSAELREVTGSTTDSDESRHNPLTMSTMSTRNNSLNASMFSHHIMTRSLPTIEGSFHSQSLRKFKKSSCDFVIDDKCFSPTEPEHSINIPSYIVRGAGKQTHVEYEIRIFLADDRWLLLRRFSRFRELHLSMKAIYGEKVRCWKALDQVKCNLFICFCHRSAKSRSPSANCLHQTAKVSLKRGVANWKPIFVVYSLFAQERQQVQSTMAMEVKV